MNPIYIVLLVLAVIGVYVALDSTFVVSENERVIVVELGDVVGQNYDPGLHFKLPFVQDVRRFDDRTLTLTGEIERVLTAESKNLTVDYFVMWEIGDTLNYYLSSQGNAARARALLTEIVENDLLAAFSKRTMRQAIDDDRNEIVATVQVLADKDAKSLGIHIRDVRIMRLDLPKAVSQAVFARMRSERQEVIKALRAKGAAAAQEIRADADRQRTITLAEAYGKAQKIKGEGDAKAADIYAQAYTGHDEFYRFYRSMELYRESVGKKDILVLEPKGRLFEYFNPPAKP
ncbi:MAG: protease modulator HflC [Salinisphaera sp.]|nr:protease modulator HflC [Salinisphaera sp.]